MNDSSVGLGVLQLAAESEPASKAVNECGNSHANSPQLFSAGVLNASLNDQRQESADLVIHIADNNPTSALQPHPHPPLVSSTAPTLASASASSAFASALPSKDIAVAEYSIAIDASQPQAAVKVNSSAPVQAAYPVAPTLPQRPYRAQWQCEKCTLLNEIANVNCAACNSQRPVIQPLNGSSIGATAYSPSAYVGTAQAQSATPISYSPHSAVAAPYPYQNPYPYQFQYPYQYPYTAAPASAHASITSAPASTSIRVAVPMAPSASRQFSSPYSARSSLPQQLQTQQPHTTFIPAPLPAAAAAGVAGSAAAAGGRAGGDGGGSVASGGGIVVGVVADVDADVGPIQALSEYFSGPVVCYPFKFILLLIVGPPYALYKCAVHSCLTMSRCIDRFCDCLTNCFVSCCSALSNCFDACFRCIGRLVSCVCSAIAAVFRAIVAAARAVLNGVQFVIVSISDGLLFIIDHFGDAVIYFCSGTDRLCAVPLFYHGKAWHVTLTRIGLTLSWIWAAFLLSLRKLWHGVKWLARQFAFVCIQIYRGVCFCLRKIVQCIRASYFAMGSCLFRTLWPVVEAVGRCGAATAAALVACGVAACTTSRQCMTACLGGLGDCFSAIAAFIYGRVLCPIGRGIVFVFVSLGQAIRWFANGVWWVLSSIVRGIWKWVFVPIGTCISVTAQFIYEHILTPIGHVIRAACQCFWRGVKWLANGIWWIISGIALGIWNYVLVPISKGIRAVMKCVWASIKWFFKGIWSIISTVATFLWTNILAPIGRFIRYIFAGIYRAIAAVLLAVWSGVSAVFRGIGFVLSTIASAAWTALRAIGRVIIGAVSAVGSAIRSVLRAVGAAIRAVYRSLKALC